MAAMLSHSTETVDAEWDGGANVKNMLSGQDPAYYRSMFAWQDTEGDPSLKGSYKFPHHMVSSDGAVGPANTRAASGGIAALNGARGGANIPDNDRARVYSHLARHLNDAGKDAPDLASSPRDEQLSAGHCFEFKTAVIRELKTDTNGSFSGYASAYTKDLQGDKIQPGAFALSIQKSGGVVPIFYNHDEDQFIGLSTSLAEDGKGLMLTGQLMTKTLAGQNAYELLQFAADNNFKLGMSIGFMADEWSWDDNGTRTLTQIDLMETSLTPFPAQPKAFVSDVKRVRELERYLKYFPKADQRLIRPSDLNVTSTRYIRAWEQFLRAPSEG